MGAQSPESHLGASSERAMRETKEYAAGIRDDPTGCPMFPDIDRSNGAAEALCYMQGFLAGRLMSSGTKPTREQMERIRHDVMHDDAVRDIVVGMQDATLSVPGGTVTSHEG